MSTHTQEARGGYQKSSSIMLCVSLRQVLFHEPHLLLPFQAPHLPCSLCCSVGLTGLTGHAWPLCGYTVSDLRSSSLHSKHSYPASHLPSPGFFFLKLVSHSVALASLNSLIQTRPASDQCNPLMPASKFWGHRREPQQNPLCPNGLIGQKFFKKIFIFILCVYRCCLQHVSISDACSMCRGQRGALGHLELEL